MPRNGSGTFNRIYNWTTDAANGIDIEASRMDGEFDGLATGLSNSIAKDGQTTITANIPFNSKKITTLANGSARTDSIALGQVQDNSFGTLGTLGGSADTYTATPLPAITAYATGSEFNLKVNVDNTGASTLNVSAVAAKNIKKYDGAGSKIDLEAGDLQQDQYYKVIYDGTDFVLIGKNPVTTSTTSTAGQSLLPNSITISNGTDADHDIDFTAGNFQFDDGSGQAVATALTKQIDAAWVAGDNAGGLFTGSVAADTFYYCFVIKNLSTGVIDAGFDPSYSSPTLPSGYTKKAYRGAILTDGSGNIKNGSYTFFNGGYRFIYSTAVLNYSAITPAYNTYNITCPPFSLALIDGDLANSSTASYTKFQVGSTIEGDGIFSGVISNTVASRSAITPPFPIKVDSNSQIKFGYVDGIQCSYSLYINGWIEYL